MSRFVFVDTETTSLNRRTRRAWEVALIVRRAGHSDWETSWMVSDPNLAEADPQSLKIGRFFERHPQFRRTFKGQGEPLQTEEELAHLVERYTRDAVLIGSVPDFDEQTLADLLYRYGLCPSWNYHLVDVENLAAGALRLPPPWDTEQILAAYGLAYDEADRHTALGDARMARALYDAVMTGQPAIGGEA